MDTKDNVIDTIGVSSEPKNCDDDVVIEDNNSEICDDVTKNDKELDSCEIQNESKDISQDCSQNKSESTALVVINRGGLITAQKMFKKSIKFSIKSFLISISVTILNFFI